MSKPANSLAAYRSYSFYHVLCLCDSTETADALSVSTDLSIWDHATPTNKTGVHDLGRYSPKCVNATGKYCVLINGSQDATYVITQAKWSTVTAGQAVPGDRGNSIAVEGSIQVSEPKGIAFLDQIVKCSGALGVDGSQVVYLLKTFFVGHLDDREDSIYQNVISDIPPINCIVVDVTGAFTELGGTYEMTFVSVSHGASRLPQYSSIPNTLTFTAGASLKDTITRLQDLVNNQYDSYFKSTVDLIAAARGVTAAEATKLLRPVKYVIETGDDYTDPKYTVTDQPAQYKNNTGCDSPAQIAFPQGTSIETALRSIMLMSLQVKGEMAAVDKKYEFKIHTTIQSKPIGAGIDCADTQFDYTVYYRVERTLSPKSTDAFDVLSSPKSETELAADPDFQKIKNNIIEFDYIYTGDNIDILEFEMKVNLGLVFLQTANLANTFKNQVDRTAFKGTKPSTEDVNNVNHRFSTDPVQIPLFFGVSIKQTGLTNTQDPTTTIDSGYTMAKHASIEMADATMRITGNDQLLSMCNRSTSSKFVRIDSKQVFGDDTGQSERPFNQWSNVPTFAKVKVKMPRNNDDLSLFTGEGPGKSADYAEDFWFDGYYYVYGIDHVFDQGEFTQTLQMFAIPKKDLLNAETKDVTKPVGTAPENTVQTTPNNAGAGRGFINPSLERPGSDGSPTNKEDAKSSTTNKDISAVPGWKTASPDVQRAVLSAANQYGINPVTLASMISVESNFKMSAKNPKSSASGLGQFIDTTWLGQIKKDPAIGVDPRAPKAVQLAAKTDPVYSANATASYTRDNARAIGSSEPGDLYLAHFSGAGVAKEIVSLDSQGQGQTSLRQAYVNVLGDKKGNAAFEGVKQANPNIVNDSTTVSQQRAWAAKKMGFPITSSSTKSSTTASTPVSPPTKEKRTVTQVVAAVVDTKAQDSKKGVQPCGKNTG